MICFTHYHIRVTTLVKVVIKATKKLKMKENNSKKLSLIIIIMIMMVIMILIMVDNTSANKNTIENFSVCHFQCLQNQPA